MWPFRKKTPNPTPEDVVEGEIRASYHPDLEHWEFQIETIEFTLAGRQFDRNAFGWARETSEWMTLLAKEIDQSVLSELEGFRGNIMSRQLLSVCLDDFAEKREAALAFVGDETWGDYGIDVILADGKVLGANCGD